MACISTIQELDRHATHRFFAHRQVVPSLKFFSFISPTIATSLEHLRKNAIAEGLNAKVMF